MNKAGISIKSKFSLLLVVLTTFVFCSFSVSAQPPSKKLRANLKNYIAQYSETAVKQMIEFKIPASVIIAQAIFESASGTSDLAKKSNNHFGIKCHMEWYGDTIVKHDDTLNECFRKYDRVEQSYRDHSLFLVTRERYTDLFNFSISDYKSWCYGLKASGYATYDSYADELIKLIEEQKLYELDNTVNLSRSFVYRAPSVEQPSIQESNYYAKAFTLKEFCSSGLIWLDEKDVLIQSLDMVVEAADEETDIAVGD